MMFLFFCENKRRPVFARSVHWWYTKSSPLMGPITSNIFQPHLSTNFRNWPFFAPHNFSCGTSVYRYYHILSHSITYYRHLVLLNTPGWGVSSPCSLLRLADFVAVEAWQATLGLHIVEHGAKRLPHAQTNWPSDVLGFCCWAPWWNGARRTAYPKTGRLFRTPTPIIPTQGGTVSLNIVQTTNQRLVTRSFTAIFS